MNVYLSSGTGKYKVKQNFEPFFVLTCVLEAAGPLRKVNCGRNPEGRGTKLVLVNFDRFGQTKDSEYLPTNQTCVVFRGTSKIVGVFRLSLCECFGA